MGMNYPDGNGGIRSISFTDTSTLASKTEVETSLASYAKKTELAPLVSKSEVANSLASYAQKSEVKNLVEPRFDKTLTLTKGISAEGTENDFMQATFELAYATLEAGGSIVRGDPHFTGTPTFDHPVTNIPTASTTDKGGVKVGSGLQMNGDTLNCTLTAGETYTLPTASTTTKGGVKVGNGLSMNGDTLNCTISNETYTLPTASTTTKGGVKVGSGLQMNGDTLNVTLTAGTTYALPTASTTAKGGVKVGTGLSMNGETLNATQYTLPTASTTAKGGVKVGSGLSMNGETLTCTVQGASNNFTSKVTLSGGIDAHGSENNLTPIDIRYSSIDARHDSVYAYSSRINAQNSNITISNGNVNATMTNINAESTTINAQRSNINIGTATISGYATVDGLINFAQGAVFGSPTAIFSLSNNPYFVGTPRFQSISGTFQNGNYAPITVTSGIDMRGAYANRVPINIQYSNIDAGTGFGSASISGDPIFSGNPIFNNPVTPIAIDSGAKNYNGGVWFEAGTGSGAITLTLTGGGIDFGSAGGTITGTVTLEGEKKVLELGRRASIYGNEVTYDVGTNSLFFKGAGGTYDHTDKGFHANKITCSNINGTINSLGFRTDSLGNFYIDFDSKTYRIGVTQV